MQMKLSVKNQGEPLPELSHEIPANGIITVGSEPSASINLPGADIAPEQFVVVCEDQRMTLLCRVDGTVINGETLPQGALHNLAAGDTIVVGDYTITAENASELNNAAGEAAEKPGESRNSGSFKAPVFPSETSDRFEKSLSDVLEGLRAEEKFYFQIESTETGENRRVYVEAGEMWLGWSDASGCVLTAEVDEIQLPRAQVRKDWSGVVIYPLQPGSVGLNDQQLNEPHRLKNDDRLSLLAREGSKHCATTLIRFHEPTALLVLDSILPKELPPPISLDEAKQKEVQETVGAVRENINAAQATTASPKNAAKNLFFGYFSLIELIIMAVGTLITAAIIFLILELY